MNHARRQLVLAITTFALATGASAQDGFDARVVPITGPVRDGGTLHLATRTWTRKAQAADLGHDTIYDNTCFTSYYATLSGDRFVDEGRVPSITSPTNLGSRPGCDNAYEIDGFQIAYCTDQPGFSSSTTTIAFYETYVACTSVAGVTPTASFALTGLPSTIAGTTCWTITIDLDAPPQPTALGFTLVADGDGVYALPDASNLFGWSIEDSLPDASQTSTGPVLAGNPNACARYDGTRWDSPVNYAEPGTGMSSDEVLYVENGPTPPGCFFGQGFLGSFHLELYSDACEDCGASAACAPPLQYCFGDGTGTACPCGNSSPVGANVGCLNSIGIGARLRGTGNFSLSNDTFTLLGDQMASSSCLYFQGTLQSGSPPGSGTAFGDGKRCAGGIVIRLGAKTNVAGASQYPQAGDASISVRGAITVPGSVRTYQAWYRNAASFCTSSTFNLSNGLEVLWGS